MTKPAPSALRAVPVSFVYVHDRDRAIAFYRDVLGLSLTGSDAFGDFLGLADGLLRLTVLPDHVPTPHPVFGLGVADISDALGRLKKRGVSFDPMGEAETPEIWTSPDGAMKLAAFKDSEGNVLTLSQAI